MGSPLKSNSISKNLPLKLIKISLYLVIFSVKPYKSGCIVIPFSLCIAKSLQQRVGLHQAVLEHFHLRTATADKHQKLQHNPCRLRLASTTLASDNDALILIAIV